MTHHVCETMQDKDTGTMAMNRELYVLYQTTTLSMTLSDPNRPKPPHFVKCGPSSLSFE